MMNSYKRAQSFERGSDDKINLFVYGTLKNPKTQEFVTGHKEKMQTENLQGYTKEVFETPDGRGYSTIKQKMDSNVHGDILKVNGDDLKKLKTWEDEYDCKDIDVNGLKCKTFILKNKDKTKEEK